MVSLMKFSKRCITLIVATLSQSVLAQEIHARLLNDSSWGIFMGNRSKESISIELNGNAKDINVIENKTQECDTQKVNEILIKINSSNNDNGESYFYKAAVTTSGKVIFISESVTLEKTEKTPFSNFDICKYIDADLNLNLLYKKKINSLKSPVLLDRFKDSQRKWLIYRDAACIYESTDLNYKIDSDYLLSVNKTCISKMTAERNEYIKNL